MKENCLLLARSYQPGDLINWLDGVRVIVSRGGALSCLPGGNGVYEYTTAVVRTDRMLTNRELGELWANMNVGWGI